MHEQNKIAVFLTATTFHYQKLRQEIDQCNSPKRTSDGLARSPIIVIPAKAGIQNILNSLDYYSHRNENLNLKVTTLPSIIDMAPILQNQETFDIFIKPKGGKSS
jgi:hypothetical protein